MAKSQIKEETVQKPPYRQPAHHWEYAKQFDAFLEFMSRYQTATKKQVEFEAKISVINEVRAKINEWHSLGVIGMTTDQINYLNKQENDLNRDIELSNINVNGVATEIVYFTGKLLSHYYDIVEDYEGGYLTLFQYKAYLLKYKTILANRIELDIFNSPTIPVIEKAIAKYLVTESITA